MNENLSVSSCSVSANGSQNIKYNNPEFPAYLQKIKFPEEKRFSVTDHWHDELEFIYCISGKLNYTVEGRNITLNKGEGIFVNSRKLHVVSHIQDSSSEFYCIIIHPMLLSASKYIDAKYIEPIIHNPNISYVMLHSSVPWENEVLYNLAHIYEMRSEKTGAISLMIDFFKLWMLLYEHLDLTEKESSRPNHNLSTLKNMIAFIHNSYQDKISLEDIASSGNVGKTMCIGIFNSYVNKTPGEFLREYRIQQSIDLLKETDMSITEISYETGFSGASYYTKIFRESTGMTPVEYRKKYVG